MVTEAQQGRESLEVRSERYRVWGGDGVDCLGPGDFKRHLVWEK